MKLSELQAKLDRLALSLEYLSTKSKHERLLKLYADQLDELLVELHTQGVQDDVSAIIEDIAPIPNILKKK